MTFSSEAFEVTGRVGASAGADVGAATDSAGGERTALFHGHHLDLVRLAGRGGVGVSYLRTAVINGCRSVHRRRKVARRHEAEPPGDAGQVSAEQEVICAERHREVAAALARLPRRRREVLVLRYYLELSEAEIAETLNISTGTVKSSAARGLATLAKTLRNRGIHPATFSWLGAVPEDGLSDTPASLQTTGGLSDSGGAQAGC